MAQYQTFPGTAGHSRTLDKLKALRLPSMGGLRFLDAGCNEGFFCGYAKFDGAVKSVGIDNVTEYISRARVRFPGCEFLEQSWDELPDEQFDVILLASALHYAEDQEGLIKRLMSRLATGGVLVLEVGIASSERSEWVKVRRGIDERCFPTLPKLQEVLTGYAWKWVGPSVLQDGDPVRRHVFHVHHRLPLAYLLMQPPGFGKSSIAARLFHGREIPVISGDQMLLDVAQGSLAASSELSEVVRGDFSSLAIDQTTHRIFEAGLEAELVALWLAIANGGDIAVDAYVPQNHHTRVEELMGSLGYLPVRLEWGRKGPSILAGVEGVARADAFYEALMAQGDVDASTPALNFKGTVGFVDEVSCLNDLVIVRGWAVHESGAMPEYLGVRIQGEMRVFDKFDRHQRPDVQAHLGLPHDVCGFRITFALPSRQAKPDVGATWEVFGGNAVDSMDGPFHVSAAV